MKKRVRPNTETTEEEGSKRKRPKYTGKFIVTIIVLAAIVVGAVSCVLALFDDGDSGRGNVGGGGSEQLSVELCSADENGVYRQTGAADDLFAGLWEPNAMKVVFLEIRNKSEFAVNCSLALQASIGELKGAFEYCGYASEYYGVSGESWQTVSAGCAVEDLEDGANEVQNGIAIEANSSVYYAVVVHMKADGGNEYQNRSCAVDVVVLAAKTEE